MSPVEFLVAVVIVGTIAVLIIGAFCLGLGHACAKEWPTPPVDYPVDHPGYQRLWDAIWDEQFSDDTEAAVQEALDLAGDPFPAWERQMGRRA